MKLRVIFGFVCALALHLGAADSPEYEALKANAEKLYAEGSFAKANELYRQVAVTNLPAAEQRWVQFRSADTQWRSQAATQTADTTKLDEAQRQLEMLVRDVVRLEDRDRLWAEVEESLGDFFWARRDLQNWGEAWPHYQLALDWWAGAPDIELARQHYLGIVFKTARPPGAGQDNYYGYWGNNLPIEVIDNALTIAQSGNDQARLHYLLAMTLRNQGDWTQRSRIPGEFEAALKPGKSTEWYDDALYNYAEWMNSSGDVIPLANGSWKQEPNYVKALELFRRIATEFSKGESRYWDQAQQQIRQITGPTVNVSVAQIFLPDSEIQYYLNWRNVKEIELTLYPVELNRDVRLSANNRDRADWLNSIDLTKLEKLRSWTYDTRARSSGATNRENDYKPGSATVHLEGKLKPGAYVIEARGGAKAERELILVTDAVMVMKNSAKQALVYFCNALDGSPLARGKVKLWERWYEDNAWHIHEESKDTGDDGIAVFNFSTDRNRNVELFVSGIAGDRQAFVPGYGNGYAAQMEPWRIYAFTDRPAYRPKETVDWKFIARRYEGSVYSTPNDQVIEFEIADPRGAKVKSDKATLNAFGSAWGSLELTEQMPLGEYHVTFWDAGRAHVIGNATLFRLEEYKLPEFKVSVQTPQETGPNGVARRQAFRSGEKVEVAIQSDYYFGGPVANASVEVLVYQNPFWHSWRRPHDYPWFYEDMENGSYSRWNRSYGGGQIIKRDTIKTDAMGKATVTFDTPVNAGQDFEYRIEARVTDASRREIIGNGTVRVTRQRYYVYPAAAHNLYRPQDKVKIDFKALDANEQPVSTEGTVRVTRDYWFEIWLAPDGHEVKGDELKRAQVGMKIWPPPPARPDQKDWRLKFRGYEHDDVLTKVLKTDTNGEAQLTFTPEREGYYRVAWTSEDSMTNRLSPLANTITAETAVWVGNNNTTELGYRSGGVEIIVDQDTFRVGSKAPVMLVAPTSDRYVLFSSEGDGLYDYQLVHLTGTVKLVELPIEEKHVPNIFLNAVLVNDRQIFTDTKQVIVPPAKNFLSVEVTPDRLEYQPREEGTFTITTRNDEGKPVSAEVALGLVDESVYYIQGDYAGDPRQFYFGTKRPLLVQTSSTMNQKSYARLMEAGKDQLLDEREIDRLKSELPPGRAGGGGGGGGGIASRNETLSLEGGKNRGIGSTGNVSMGGNRQMNFFDASEMLEKKAPAAAMPAPIAEGGEPMEPAVQVRTDFRSTVFWQPDLVTDRNGKATVKVKYPDSLTGWKATARAASSVNQFGIAETTTRTKQPLIVRLQAPRFFVVGDAVTISAVINNNTDRKLRVTPQLEAEGLTISGLYVGTNGVVKGERAAFVDVGANSEARVDWAVSATQAGEARLKVTGRAEKYADGMQKTYTVYEHGIEKFIAKSGKARGNDITIKLDLPRERKAGSTALTVQITPSMAVTMLDALPYLIDYPYGCTEQTMSRFLPAVITAKTLRDLGLEPATVMARVFGGIETNSAGATHPGGRRDLDKLDGIMNASLDRLYNFQHGDGGWGWWKEGDSDHWMTAYVIWGLSLARDAGVPVKMDVLGRAVSFLTKEIVEEEESPDLQAWMLHALAAYRAPQNGAGLTKFEETAFNNLWTKREKLNAYTRALFALSAHGFGKTNEAKILVANLENGVKRDDRPDASVLIKGGASTGNSPSSTVIGTAHWGEDGIYWRWSEGGVEATAFALRALLAIDPQNKLIEPVTNWLIKNRRGAQWSNTRDTAIVVLTMNEYLRAGGELKGGIEYEVLVNGSSVAKKKISGADVFNAPGRLVIDPKLINDSNEVRIKTIGNGATPLYFAVEGKFFSLEEPIAPAGNEIFVKREYYKLVGRPTLLKGHVYDREPLRDGDSVKSGERVETLLTIEGKNNYEYLLFEDLKPAGLEAVELRSGESVYARELKSGAVGNAKSGVHSAQAGQSDDYTGRTRWVYQELRDRKVALFIDKLPEGIWEIRYDLRAEVPGRFHALPVTGQAMYVPEIRANGSEVRIGVDGNF